MHTKYITNKYATENILWCCEVNISSEAIELVGIMAIIYDAYTRKHTEHSKYLLIRTHNKLWPTHTNVALFYPVHVH